MANENQKITFSFGKNWRSFIDTVDEGALSSAIDDIKRWVPDSVLKLRILDIGCGSGIHSYAFWKLGAAEVVSFDYDQYSVEATKRAWEIAGCPQNWKIQQGSVLDEQFLKSLGQFDFIYSWGVLHHTGHMWDAIKNAITIPVKETTEIWIALYQNKSSYASDIALKEKYNKKGFFGKKIMELQEIIKIMKARRRKGLNPLKWNEKRGRGMSTYYDIVDWLGGLPYEVATREEVDLFFKENGNWYLQKYNPEQSCYVYYYSHKLTSDPLFIEYPY